MLCWACLHSSLIDHMCLQSSLLALLLASKFFPDPLVRLPCGLSVIVMTLVRALLLGRCQVLPLPQVQTAPLLLVGRVWPCGILAASRCGTAAASPDLTRSRLRGLVVAFARDHAASKSDCSSMPPPWTWLGLEHVATHMWRVYLARA